MYETFVAIGDSFTEGLDDRRPDGSYRGWAEDAQRASTYFAPWLGRKLRDRSAGDFVDPKLPELTAMSTIPRARTTADHRPTVSNRPTRAPARGPIRGTPT
jgi:hypothetical protein